MVKAKKKVDLGENSYVIVLEKEGVFVSVHLQAFVL